MSLDQGHITIILLIFLCVMQVLILYRVTQAYWILLSGWTRFRWIRRPDVERTNSQPDEK